MSEKARVATGLVLFSLAAVFLSACSSSDAPGTVSTAGSGAVAGSSSSHAGAPGSSGAGGAGGAGIGGAGIGGALGGNAGTVAGAGGANAGAPGAGGVPGSSYGGSAGAPGGAGQSSTICEVPATEAQRKAPAFPPTTIPNPKGLRFRFMNNCPMTLWLKASNAANQFPGNNGVVQLAPRATAEFDMPQILQRVTAYTKAAPGTVGSIELQFTEMNAEPGKALNVNLSHVDWLALPVEVKGVGTDKTCTTTACYQPFSTILKNCPAQLLDTAEGKCHAPNWYCGAHANEPFCQALMASAKNTLDNDPDCVVGKGTTFTPNDVFGCAGFFDGDPAKGHTNGTACCAKVNRNYQGNATKQTHLDNCAFYKDQPYNVYAKWAHQQCPLIYAFAYDDVAEQSGYLGCIKGTEMDVTYCPGDP